MSLFGFAGYWFLMYSTKKLYCLPQHWYLFLYCSIMYLQDVESLKLDLGEAVLEKTLFQVLSLSDTIFSFG